MTPLAMAAVTALLASAGDELARVEGIPVSRDDVARRIAAAAGQGRAMTPVEAAESIVVDVLLAGEGRRRGLASTAKVQERIVEQTRRAAAQQLVDELAPTAEPEESELRRIFHATADAVAFESLTFETRDQAEAAVSRIRKGSSLEAEAPRAVTARLAKGPEGVPPVIRGELTPELARALFAAAPGQTVGPVESGPGWEIARVVKASIGSDAEFARRRESLRAFARRQASAQARKHVVEQLRRQAKVGLDEAFLRGLQGTEATPAQLDTVIATVGERPLRYRDIHPSVKALGAGGGHMASAAVKIQVAQQEIDNRLLQDAALRRGLDRGPGVAARRPEFERNALAATVVEEVRASTPPPTEEEIEAFYRENAPRFGRPFSAVLSEAARGAAEQKKARAVSSLVEDLRRKGNVSIDRDALARLPAAP